MKLYQALISLLLFISPLFSSASPSKTPANTHFVILVYHHVSESTPAVTSISPEQFKRHLEYIEQHHHVISLDEAVNALNSHQRLPEYSVVITFDDGYSNIYEHAFPLLKAKNFPFTVFVNPDQINQSRAQLTWQQIEEMRPLATFANHTINHLHLLNKLDAENEEMWLKRVMHNIEQAETRLQAKLGYSKKWLAYPFGEYNNTLKAAVLEAGYLGFAQHSGAVSNYTDHGAIPRFPAAGIYANLDTLKTKLKSLAMPVIATHPADPVWPRLTPLRDVSITLMEYQDIQHTQLACYYQGERISHTFKQGQITIDKAINLGIGRSRINCTAPSVQNAQRYYWYSSPFFVADPKGRFID